MKSGTGNTFTTESYEWTNGQRRVWREIRHRYPSGGKLSAEALAANKGKVIPSGSPVTFDQLKKEITLVTGKEGSPAVVDGFIQEDIYVRDDGTYAGTATVVYAGELYEPVLNAILDQDASALAAVKKAAPGEIKFVR